MTNFFRSLLVMLIMVSFWANAQVTTVSPTDERIQYYGRWDFSNNPERPIVSWGAAYIKVKFNGTGIKINIHDPKAYFQYQVDDGPLTEVTAGSKIVDLGQSYTDGEHVLGFYRKTNGNVSLTQFRGFEITGEIIDPDPRPCLKFEFVGNSISMGFGNAGSGGVTAANTNGYMAWGPQVARLFGAEWSVTAHSGQGMYQNMAYIEGAVTMSDEYELWHFPAAPITNEIGWNAPAGDWYQPDYPYDFNSQRSPDVHFCALGTNDVVAMVPPYEGYTERYHRYLDTVRAHHPKALIVLFGICLETSDLPDHRYDYGNIYLDSIVTQRKRDYGDDNIMWINPRPDYNDASMFLQPDGIGETINWIGDKTHPTVLGNTIIAERIYEILEPIIGTEHCGEEDCNGELNGLAFTNSCAHCVGGSTGRDEEYCPTAVTDDEFKKSLVLYPNPTSSTVALSKRSAWTLVNKDGEILGGGEGKVIDLTGKASGMYLIYVNGEAHKIIKE